jgi:polyphosphate kinase 2 (PPK2 family)
MSENKPAGELTRARVRDEMLDSFDEELEMELDDARLADLVADASNVSGTGDVERTLYFKELFRLQGELVKLQDWVQHQKLKVVVLFEGRDAAGKGGVIKRITQRLNPRVCRVARCRRRASASARNGISSATSRICRPAARSCCSTAAGTTAPASSA